MESKAVEMKVIVPEGVKIRISHSEINFRVERFLIVLSDVSRKKTNYSLCFGSIVPRR